jgi:acyl-CoA dehydrogenase
VYEVASSDATNLKNTTARAEGDTLVLNGHKWVGVFYLKPPRDLHSLCPMSPDMAIWLGRTTVADLHQWISGAGDPRNALHIVLAITDPHNPSPHRRHSLVLVDPKSKGVDIVRPMMVFGYDDAPEGHCEVKYRDVRVPASSIVGGKDGLGRGFEMIQARLG